MLEADESCTLDIVKVNDVTQVMSASLEYGQFWGGGAKPCFKTCVPQVKNNKAVTLIDNSKTLSIQLLGTFVCLDYNFVMTLRGMMLV